MSPSARGQPKFGVPHVTPGPRGNVLPGKAVQKVLERLRDKILDAPVAKGAWESHEPRPTAPVERRRREQTHRVAREPRSPIAPPIHRQPDQNSCADGKTGGDRGAKPVC